MNLRLPSVGCQLLRPHLTYTAALPHLCSKLQRLGREGDSSQFWFFFSQVCGGPLAAKPPLISTGKLRPPVFLPIYSYLFAGVFFSLLLTNKVSRNI